MLCLYKNICILRHIINIQIFFKFHHLEEIRVLFQQTAMHRQQINLRYYNYQNKFVPPSAGMTTERHYQTIEELQPNKISQSIRSESAHFIKWGNPTDQILSTLPEMKQSEHFESSHKSAILKDKTIDAQDTYLIQGGFKKNKSHQIFKLSELKHEYEILKSIKIQDEFIKSGKGSKRMNDESSVQSSNSEASVSRKTKTHSRRKKAEESEYYERHQLQMLVSESMKKIEQMLNNQIEYKRMIHQLTLKIDHIQSKNQKPVEEDILDFNFQLERIKQLNYEQAEKIGQLEGQLAVKQVQMRKLQFSKTDLEKQLKISQDKYFDLDRETKRILMENQLMIREKTLIMDRFERMINQEGLKSNQSQIQRQLREKEEQNLNLLKEIQNLKSQLASKGSEVEENAILHQMLKKINLIEGKSESAMVNEMNGLKSQLQHMKNQQVNEEEKSSLESRIYTLEKIIDDENIEKMKFMEELKTMTDEYIILSQGQKKLEQNIKNMEVQQTRLKNVIKSLRQDLSASQSVNSSLSNSQVEIGNLKMRVKVLEGYQKDNERLKVEIKHLQNKNLEVMYDDDEKIRNLARKVDSSQFQIEKLKKQNVFNLQLAERKTKAEIELVKNGQQRAETERDEWKRQYENIKSFYETRQNQLQKDLQKVHKQHNEKLKNKDEQQAEIKTRHDQELQGLRQRYEREQTSIINRLQSLTKTNERFAVENSKFLHMESELHDLRQKYKKQASLTTNVHHLWQVKEIEYQNINEIMKSLQSN